MFWRHGGDYSFKWGLFSLQNMLVCLVKDDLLLYKRRPFANVLETSVNRKKKPLKCNKPKVFAVTRSR